MQNILLLLKMKKMRTPGLMKMMMMMITKNLHDNLFDFLLSLVHKIWLKNMFRDESKIV